MSKCEGGGACGGECAFMVCDLSTYLYMYMYMHNISHVLSAVCIDITSMNFIYIWLMSCVSPLICMIDGAGTVHVRGCRYESDLCYGVVNTSGLASYT